MPQGRFHQLLGRFNIVADILSRKKAANLRVPNNQRIAPAQLFLPIPFIAGQVALQHAHMRVLPA